MKTALECSLRGGVIAPRSRPGSPGGARPDARRLPATGHGWRRRNGPATGLRPASATAPASSRRYFPAARRSRPAHRRSRLCPRGTTARCNPPEARNCPARILRSSLRVTNPAAFDPRPDRATAPPPGPPPQSSPGHCLLGRPSRNGPFCCTAASRLTSLATSVSRTSRRLRLRETEPLRAAVLETVIDDQEFVRGVRLLQYRDALSLGGVG